MAASTDHDEVGSCLKLAPDASAAMTATATAMREADEMEEVTEPKMSYSWTYWYARFTVLNDYQDLPCPVETQGAHLISAPPSPKAVASRHDPSSFYEDLFERLRGLALQQSVRENVYGEEFANEWPISRTPRALADEVREARRRAQDALLPLDSSSEEEAEYEPAWMRRLREAREKRRRARAQGKAEAAIRADVEVDAEAQFAAETRLQIHPPQLSPPQDDAVIKSTVDAVADQA